MNLYYIIREIILEVNTVLTLLNVVVLLIFKIFNLVHFYKDFHMKFFYPNLLPNNNS